MKKIFSFTKKKKHSFGTPDSGSVLSVGYELKEKDLGKVHKAASVGDLAKLKHLAKKNDLNQLDKENRTALHIACASGHVEVVQFLVENKAKLNLCDNQNRSALMKAVQGQHEYCASILLENNAEPNLVDINGNTALHLAANIPSISTAVLLLQREAAINAPNKEGFTPLTVAVREDHIDMAEFLLKEGADVNYRDQDQRSPLMIAAGNGQICMLRLLLRFDADITLKDTKGWSADDYAVTNGHHPCSLLIIEHGTQMNDGSSLLHPGLSKKKKKNLLGSPSQDAEVGFSLGGPATDKDDFEDNSQSESLSRVSKSVADEWPSSENEDESILIEKKRQKVNLKKMIAFKKGEASVMPDRSLSGTESEPESENRDQRFPSLLKALPPSKALQHPVDPFSSLSKTHQMTSTPLPTYREGSSRHSGQISSCKEGLGSHVGSPEAEDEVGGEEEEEEEDGGEEEEEEDGEEEEEDEEDGEEEDEEEEDEEEEEEETDEDDDEEEEESEEEDCIEDDEEIDFEEEDNYNSVASVEASSTDCEPIKKGSGALEVIERADSQNVPTTVFSCNSGSNIDNVDASEKDAITETQNSDVVCPAGSYLFPATLNVKEDCVVSAIRVESKFSDEDDSVGRECTWSPDRNIDPSLGAAQGPIPFMPCTGINSPGKVKEEDLESEEEDANSWSNKQNSGETVWNDSDEEEDNQIEGFCPTVYANRINVLPEAESRDSVHVVDCKSKKETFRDKKQKSSWDSSLEDSNTDLTNEDDVNRETVDQKMNVQALDLQFESSHENQQDTSWDSSEVVNQMTEKLKSSLGLCSPRSPRSKNKLDQATVDEPEWDSSSENNDENDNGSKDEVVSPVSKASVVTANRTRERQCPDGSCEDEDEDIEREPNNPFPAVLLAPEDEKARNQILVNSDVESESPISKMGGKFESENEKGSDSSWDDEDESYESGKQKTKNIVVDCNDVLKKEAGPGDNNGDEDTENEAVEYNRPEEDIPVGVKKDGPSRHIETSEDSDSKDQKLQYDFVSAKASVVRDSDNTEEPKDKLTASTTLKSISTVISQPRVSSDDHDEEPNQEVICCSPPTKDLTAREGLDPDGSLFSCEAIPQTDIDDVDLKSPDEAEGIGMTSQEQPDLEGHVNEKQDSSEGEDDDDDDEEIEDVRDVGEGGISDHYNQPEEGRDSLDTASPVHETEVFKDKKRAENNNNDDNGGKPVSKDDMVQKETERTKWEPLSVMSKLEGDNNQKSDLMEELGLGDVDDLEDASDWDSASTTSKRTLPGCKMAASPGFEELPENSNSPVKEQDECIAPEAPLKPQRFLSSDKKLPSTPPHDLPHPQPRARKVLLQKPDSEEESDWEPDNSTSYNKTKTDNHLQQIADIHATKPGSPELSSMARDSKSNIETDNQQQKDFPLLSFLFCIFPVHSCHQKKKYDAVDTCELDKLCSSGHADSGSGEKDNDVRDQCSPEGGEAGDNAPWEKCYEKLWVEVEKREVKATFKNVACELKEKFGELCKSSLPAKDVTEEQQATAESTSAEEDSSDEEAGEIIVRPTTRARSTVLLTIPEQRESGLEDSESTDNSVCEDRSQVSGSRACKRNNYREPDELTGVGLEESSSSPHHTTAERQSNVDHATKVITNVQTTSMSGVDCGSFFKNEPNLALFPKQRMDPMWKDTMSDLDESEKNNVCPEEDPEECYASSLSKLRRHSAYAPGVSDEELEEDKERLKLEVGMLKVVFLDLEKEKTQLQKKQTYNSNKQEGKAVEGNLQMELVRGAQQGRAPQTNTLVNGDPLSVFDDSTLSEVSDDEGRLPTSGQQKIENPDEVELAEDLDELTQSSDTATDDTDSPTSGYRHASLLIQKLDSATLDSRSMVKLQNIFHEYERSIQKARSRHGYLSDKASQLEMERTELRASLEEVKDVKSALERNQLELQTEVTNLKFQLKQEQENRRNATMMYNSSKDKLRRSEEQHQLEVQEKQKVELTLRNLELEMRTLVNNMKQLEEDNREAQRLLAQERSARTLQENLLSSHLRKQQEIEEENKRNMSKSNEALSQLTEASDREKELLQHTYTLQEQLTILRTDLERSQANSSLKESHILEENEALKEQLEDARRDLKLNSEALTQTVFNCNNQVTALKSELTIVTTRLENERHTRETLEAEVESTRTRMTGALKEAERCLAAHSDTEKSLFREKEEHQRLKDRLTGESASQREAVSNLSQKLAKAEAHANSMENEVHRVTLQLTEKGLLLDVLQREKDQSLARIKELETALHTEKEMVSRAGARQETTQERLAQAQSEAMLLRQQLEEAQNKGAAKDHAVTDAQERFSDILSKLRSDCEERVQLVEERNKELASNAADLRDQIYKLEEEKREREISLRQLQQELADSLKKLSMSEASLEVNTRYRNDLEEEKVRFLKDLDRIKGKLQESEDQFVQAERRINNLKNSLDEREKELSTAAQKLQEALSASATCDTTIKQLEEAVQRLEIENARLEAAAKQQSNKIEALQKGAQEAAMVIGSRHTEEVTTWQFEFCLVQKQNMLSHTAQDSQALWEEELKSRSKLGLRLAELEKEKEELNTQMEIEKKKAKKIAEQKKAIDSRLNQEMQRNTELQKEMYRLRTLLKTAKKKLRDQETGGAEFGSPLNSLRMDLGRHSLAEGARMKEKVDDLQVQLEKEACRRSQLEMANGELKDQLASLKSLSHSNDLLERSKRQLEEEVLDLRRRMEAAQMEQSQVEQYRRDADERVRQELQQKLEQVNLFLQSQAASQEALDQIKAANEANLRSQLEQKIRELEGELGRARSTQQDSLNQRDSTRTELEQYRQLYTEELRLRKSLAAKLERANSRLAEANSKLLNERSRSFMTSTITNSGLAGPFLELGTANYGATLGPLNRSLGMGLSLSPVTEGQSSRVEDYLAKVCTVIK
ncbi:Ankyrin repeat domain-containing protein 26 [Channa argus]|uniref:Ankyrin repeat domain-containing protein 26 n=1 Tax=Channa argus TaxID=215402 RepID=A0A6G1PE30_CHAAH|nr:Ankyrin repeat domain-containing protein 26 [Channa argus]